jgi:quercetin dioxygenase-like cupin family protein
LLVEEHGRTGRSARPLQLLKGRDMDTTVIKIDSAHSPRGPGGQRYLASGVRVSMRLWEEDPGASTEETTRNYEVVGYVLRGSAELHLEGGVVILRAGDSYVVPRGTRHAYRILSPFTAVEATAPPAQVHARDEPRTEPPPAKPDKDT